MAVRKAALAGDWITATNSGEAVLAADLITASSNITTETPSEYCDVRQTKEAE